MSKKKSEKSGRRDDAKMVEAGKTYRQDKAEPEREYILYFYSGEVRRVTGRLSELQKLPVSKIEIFRKVDEL